MPPTISVLRIEDDAQRTVGFVERAGSVYVSLRGSHYSFAVEVGQSLTFERAREVLLQVREHAA
ncbi:MAG TPA: hypothetical protein VN200_07235 [Rhodoglobus sp.]|nr:hypothetical protein [Rhodoglobus sp.]